MKWHSLTLLWAYYVNIKLHNCWFNKLFICVALMRATLVIDTYTNCYLIIGTFEYRAYLHILQMNHQKIPKSRCPMSLSPGTQ